MGLCRLCEQFLLFVSAPNASRDCQVALDLAKPGSEVDLEVTVIRRPENVLARVERMPFFNPPRKTALMPEPMAGEST